MRTNGYVLLAGLLAAGCSAQIKATTYQAYTIELYGPPSPKTGQDPFAQTAQFQITLSYYEDAAGQIPYAQELGPNPPGFSNFKPQSVTTYSASLATSPASFTVPQLALPRLNANQTDFYVKAEILGLDKSGNAVARARCPLQQIQADPNNTMDAVTCQAFYGLIGQWNLIPPMKQARVDFAAVALPDGRIVVAGGRPPGQAPAPFTELSSVEVYDPFGVSGPAGQWSSGGFLNQARYGLTGTYTPDGHVVFIGGLRMTNQGEIPSQVVDIFDASSNAVTQANYSLPSVRGEHAAAQAFGAKVFIAGGVTANLENNQEVISPALDFLAFQTSPTVQATSLGNTDVDERHWPCMVDIGSQQLLLCSGTWSNGAVTKSSCEVLDDMGRSLQHSVSSVKRQHTKCDVVNGSVVLVGGDPSGTTNPSSIEVWTQAGIQALVAEPYPVDGQGVAATNGVVVVAGGYPPSNSPDDSTKWIKHTYWISPTATQTPMPVPTAELNYARSGFQLLGLPDGTVVALGGAVVAPSADPGSEILPVPDP